MFFGITERRLTVHPVEISILERCLGPNVKITNFLSREDLAEGSYLGKYFLLYFSYLFL